MFKFNNNNINSQNVLKNIFNMRYSFNSGQLNSYGGIGNTDQGISRNDKGGVVSYNGIGFVNQQNYLEQLIKYQKAQLQQQQQQLLLTQQQYEYNLQLQYQYQLQQQLNQSHLNVHQNPHIHNHQVNLTGVAGTVDSQVNEKVENMYSGVYYSNNQEEFQSLEPYEIIIIPKCDNTVTVRDVSHVDLSKNRNSRSREMEIEVEIKKGDKDIELENIRDEILSEKKISMNSDKNQEIEVNVYETKIYKGDLCSKNDVTQILDDLSSDSLNNRNIEVDLNECYEIQDEQILGSESEPEERCSYDNQGEIEIEEDSILVIKYKNDHVGTDILDLMERNIDNCVIDGNSYYYENFVRSFSSGNHSSYEDQAGQNLIGFGVNHCYLVNHDSLLQACHNSELVEILEDGEEENDEEQQQQRNKDEDQRKEIEEEKQVEETQKKVEGGTDANSEAESSSNSKKSLEELNEKIQRFNLLLEKINKMEQMNISFKEAFLSEKWNASSNMASGFKDLDDNENKLDENQSEDDKSISEYSVLDTVKDIYDSNSHIIYKDVRNSKCESSSERLDDVENELEQGEEQVQRYIQAINDYFANEGLLGVCESRLNTHRWERNYENAMSSLNNQFKDSSYNSDAISKSDSSSVADSEVDSEANIDIDEIKDDEVIAGIENKISGEEQENSLVPFGEPGKVFTNKLVHNKHNPEEKCSNQDLSQINVEDTKALVKSPTENPQSTANASQEAHLFTVNPGHTETEMAAPNLTSGTVLISSNSTKCHQRVKIPMINIPSSDDIPKKISKPDILKKSQNDFNKKGKTFLHANSTQKNVSLAGNHSNKEAKKDNEILTRLSQCRVINSKTIKLVTNSNKNLNDSDNINTNGNEQNTTNLRPRMNTCSVAFPSSNYSPYIYNNFNQHTNKLTCEKITRGPVYNNSFGGKCVNSQNKPQVPVLARKEPNLGFRSLISNGIKVNVTELMKPRVIRK
ncbi:uncharacterized protein cubi_00895 [Cryptosporidium ubiquitum]|uniref:Uncharacterized protein n=1 Tax=Cryptosporidium ubiquitum TaxID=857276 RepID=A0A1J4M956_9CRYT|nr:uncharacterized protein cubi_00895 [Cryptosporidium ubiquitum]OII70750.1 hypothetical protein cubi_00895 [Cryptosporidium ubiquitum]